MYLQWTKLISTVQDAKDITLDLPLLCLFSSCRQQTKEDTLSILFTGDVLLDRGTRPWIEREGVKGLFQGVSEAFQKADAVVITWSARSPNATLR